MQFIYSILAYIAITSVNSYAINSNNLFRRDFGTIATECRFELRLKEATTEEAFSDLMNDCNNAYTNLLVKDPSQQNAITLQSEIISIKETFAKYKDNYFIAHPIDNGSGTDPTKPLNPVQPGETIFQRCNIEGKIVAAKKREDFDPILASCSQAYNELLNNDQSRIAELNSEWLQVQNRIKVAQEEFAKTHPIDNGNGNGNGNGNSGNSGEASTEITKLVKVDERLANARSYTDFDILVQDCNAAFVTLNTDSTKTVKLQNELEYLKAKIIKARANFRP